MTAEATDLLRKAEQLPPPDRAELAEKLWESLLPGDDEELSHELKALLDERIEEMERNPGDGISFDEFRRRLKPTE
jgi:putative addiction module component (TIGR02574 family)